MKKIIKIFSEIREIPEFKKDVKELAKRFPTLKENLQVFIKRQLNISHKLKIDNKGVFQIQGIMSKQIVISSNGTWNTPEQKQEGRYNPTNVVKMARAIAPLSRDGKHQVVFYDRGIGANQWGLDRLTGGAFGNGLDKNRTYQFKNQWNFFLHFLTLKEKHS